jgi:hypothetical protein
MGPLQQIIAYLQAQQNAGQGQRPGWSQVADPNTPHFLESGDRNVQLVGEKPRPNMYYRDPQQGGPSPPGGDTFAQIVGKRR